MAKVRRYCRNCNEVGPVELRIDEKNVAREYCHSCRKKIQVIGEYESIDVDLF